MRLSALQRENAARRAGESKRVAAAKREAAQQTLDWDALIVRLRAMLDRIESESPQEA